MTTGSTGTCDSCGAEEGDLVEVRRAYVTPEAWDTEGRTELAPGTERWCFPCRTHYPHVVPEVG
ncbi:MAG TPA: hypothetical protein VMN58_10550 [Acidimicrobiales bacterium]|nr:hypothetical protein [Acidimicrobiales bacterium]